MKINDQLLTIFWVRPNSKVNNKNNPPPLTTIDKNSYCCKLAPISAYGIVMLLPANYRDSAKIIQHEDCQEESEDVDSLSQPNHWPGKAVWEGSQKRLIHSDQVS